MESRINLGKAAPDIYHALNAMDQKVNEHIQAAGNATGFAHLLRLRASQLNQCAYCVRMHTRDALTNSETNDRISVLPAWRETGYFTQKERAALSLCEAITLISQGQVSDEVYTQAAAVLDEKELAAIQWLSVAINSWNRVAISSRLPVRA